MILWHVLSMWCLWWMHACLLHVGGCGVCVPCVWSYVSMCSLCVWCASQSYACVWGKWYVWECLCICFSMCMMCYM